jgi:hypothetical protein
LNDAPAFWPHVTELDEVHEEPQPKSQRTALTW